jgi:hypothetical protein
MPPSYLERTHFPQLYDILQTFCDKFRDVKYIISSDQVHKNPKAINKANGYITFTGLHSNMAYTDKDNRFLILEEIVKYLIEELEKYGDKYLSLYKTDKKALAAISLTDLASVIIPTEVPTLNYFIQCFISYAKTKSNKTILVENLKLPIVAITHILMKIMRKRLHLPMQLAYALYLKRQSTSDSFHTNHLLGLSYTRSVFTKYIDTQIKLTLQDSENKSWFELANGISVKDQIDFFLKFATFALLTFKSQWNALMLNNIYFAN